MKGSGSRSLDITLLSADNLKKVSKFSKMACYAIVTVSGESQTTSVDREAGNQPMWNHKMRFSIDEASALKNSINVIFSIKANRGCFGDSNLGEVHVSIKEMLAQCNETEERYRTYIITTPGGRSKGTLNICYKFSAPPPNPPVYNNLPGMGPYPPPPQNHPLGPPLPQNYPGGPPSPHNHPPGPPPSQNYPPMSFMTSGGPGGYPPPQEHHPGPKPGGAGPYPPPSQGVYPPPNQNLGGNNSSGHPKPQGGYPPPAQAVPKPGAYPPP